MDQSCRRLNDDSTVPNEKPPSELADGVRGTEASGNPQTLWRGLGPTRDVIHDRPSCMPLDGEAGDRTAGNGDAA